MEKLWLMLKSMPPPTAIVNGCCVPLAVMVPPPLTIALLRFAYPFEFDPPKRSSKNGVNLEVGTFITGPNRYVNMFAWVLKVPTGIVPLGVAIGAVMFKLKLVLP